MRRNTPMAHGCSWPPAFLRLFSPRTGTRENEQARNRCCPLNAAGSSGEHFADGGHRRDPVADGFNRNHVLGTIGWDLSRFGIQFVASPRHADGLLVTGCISKNMELALKKAWDAVPEPRIVIAVGACAIAGGPFAGNPQILNGAASALPVDLYIPGCPPHPLTILDGLLRLLDRLEKKSQNS